MILSKLMNVTTTMKKCKFKKLLGISQQKKKKKL
jgi:hypothetical protein